MTTWTAAFRSAPVSAYESMTLIHPSRAFNDQTLRQVVRVRGAGDRLRIRLSNQYGKQPLTITRTSVATHDTRSSIRAGTDTAVTFEGTGQVTIDAGAEAVSDPVDFAIAGESDLAVSTYHASAAGPATYHPFALQTGYVVAGDAVSRTHLTGAEEVESRFHLGGIDIGAPEGRRVVAAFGDSLTDGVGTSHGTHHRYPDLLAGRLADTSVINLGIAGNRLLSDVFGERGIARFERDVLAAPGMTHVVVELGLNDIGLPGMLGLPAVPADELIDGLGSLARQAARAGLTAVVATLTPFGGADGVSPGFDTPEGERTRQRVNQWIRAHVDAVADLDRALRDPAAPAVLRSDYDSGDHIHPNDAGAEAMADIVARAVLESEGLPRASGRARAPQGRGPGLGR
ncbi:GDSL-type esterase/lipase family protein [Nonomuraea sp. NPDC049269]|uniref:GDSL-type esterase/lipase family protein n=1 Tax=Nonomuraea sp. NPDC049269 TaxID=3364349 RepID=UPI0037125778